MYTVHGRGVDFHFLRFGHGLVLVQMNLQHGQAHTAYALVLFT